VRIIRAPLRVSLFGGGTDLPSYYEKHGGLVISFALKQYIYVAYNKRPGPTSRLSYSVTEEVGSLTTVNHSLVRKVAEECGFDEPCTLSIIGDVPKGTGLGSSSALTVALLELAGPWVPSMELADLAFQTERSCFPRVGRQDHLPAVFGWVRKYEFSHDGRVRVVPLSSSWSKTIESYGLLLYTGIDREAEKVLLSWSESEKHIKRIHKLAKRVAEWKDCPSPQYLGHMLDISWRLKRKIPGVATERLNLQYEIAKDRGAYGGKLCGAGGGGCWFFIAPPNTHQKIVEALDLPQIPCEVSQNGVEGWKW